jgi:CRISPR-associated endonuclease/helicase Cas3
VKADAVALMAALREGETKPPSRIDDALAQLGAWRAQGRPRPQLILPYGEDEEGHPAGIVLFAPKGIARSGGELDTLLNGGTPCTEDDWLGSASGEAQTLDDHSKEVCDRGGASAATAGLVQKIAEDLALSGYLHDAGKADPRFQVVLYGGNWLEVDDHKVLAKSSGRVPPDAWEKAGLPKHWRHEALSVRIAREHPRFRAAHDPELVLWLIGVHHGYGRPLFPHADEDPPTGLASALGGLKAAPGPGPQSLAFCFNGWDWAQIFDRLKRRYGGWELARMEAIVRLADHRASEASAN